MVIFERVSTQSEIESVANLAEIIWHEAYQNLLSKAQRDYMIARFQSTDAIKNQIEEGMEYFLLFYHDQLAGYLGIGVENNCLLLSKIYLLQSMRGKGIFAEIIHFVSDKARNEKYPTLRLYVNKHNQALRAYQACGFKVIGSVVKDIGSGYVMDDYCMELQLL